MAFKEQVDKILENRKIQLEKVVEDEKMISELTKNLTEIKNAIAKNSDSGFGEFLVQIDDALGKLNNAKRKIGDLKKRFNRKTVNIGVSGAARVGKSTFLQAITGLSDNQIPTGNGGPVTATRSVIENQGSDKADFAQISFYTESEFIENRVKPYADLIGETITDVTALESFNSSKFSFGQSDENSVRKNTALQKLTELKDSISDYSELLTGSSTVLQDISDLRSYVAFDGIKKLYPAVKSVEIHCHFPSLDGVNLQLVDLPGFGTIAKIDDAVQLEGLQSNVDHALLILRPEQTSVYVGENHANLTETLSKIQPDVKDRAMLFSYILNHQNGNESIENTFKNDLLSKDKNVTDGRNLYTANFKDDKNTVNNIFESILEGMIRNIPIMDKAFLDSYKTEFNFDEIKKSIEEINGKILNIKNELPSNARDISQKADKMIEKLRLKYKELSKIYNQNADEELCQKVNEIKNRVREGIDKDLFFSPTEDYKTWLDMAKLKGVHAITDCYSSECNRVRIEIINSYTELNSYYNEKLEELLENLISIFRDYTGNLVSNEYKGSEAVKKILEKLKTKLSSNAIITGLEFLDNLRIDFRQHVYPVIFLQKDMELLDPDITLLEPSNLPLDEDERLNEIKERITANAIQNNMAVKDAIIANDFTYGFLKSALVHFNDILLVSDSNTKYDFQDFVERFEDSMGLDSSFNNQADFIRALSSKMNECLILISNLEAK